MEFTILDAGAFLSWLEANSVHLKDVECEGQHYVSFFSPAGGHAYYLHLAPDGPGYKATANTRPEQRAEFCTLLERVADAFPEAYRECGLYVVDQLIADCAPQEPGAADASRRPAPGKRADDKLPDERTMRGFFPSYNQATAMCILGALPRAYVQYMSEQGRWGPTLVGREAGVSRETASRYLNAFKKAGMGSYQDIQLP